MTGWRAADIADSILGRPTRPGGQVLRLSETDGIEYLSADADHLTVVWHSGLRGMQPVVWLMRLRPRGRGVMLD